MIFTFSQLSYKISARGGAEAARKAHNLEVAGSNPVPATKSKVLNTLASAAPNKMEKRP